MSCQSKIYFHGAFREIVEACCISDHQIVKQYGVVGISKEGDCKQGCHIAGHVQAQVGPHPCKPHTVYPLRVEKAGNVFAVVCKICHHTQLAE